jgi:hypothetical protein
MLGDVMRESAQAAVTFVRSNAQAQGGPEVFQKNSVHIHPSRSGAEGRPVGRGGDAERGRVGGSRRPGGTTPR